VLKHISSSLFLPYLYTQYQLRVCALQFTFLFNSNEYKFAGSMLYNSESWQRKISH